MYSLALNNNLKHLHKSYLKISTPGPGAALQNQAHILAIDWLCPRLALSEGEKWFKSLNHVISIFDVCMCACVRESIIKVWVTLLRM